MVSLGEALALAARPLQAYPAPRDLPRAPAIHGPRPPLGAPPAQAYRRGSARQQARPYRLRPPPPERRHRDLKRLGISQSLSVPCARSRNKSRLSFPLHAVLPWPPAGIRRFVIFPAYIFLKGDRRSRALRQR